MRTYFFWIILFFMGISMVACKSGEETPPFPSDTTPAIIENTPSDGNPTPPSEITDVPVPTATSEPRNLTICMGAEPDSLYLYGTNMHAASNILEAVYDGPIDTNRYSYQPVIIEKVPSIADGDAVLQPVTVQEGDLVVAADGSPIILSAGVTIHPAGCQSAGCTIPFAGGETQMDQLSVTFSLLADLKWSDGQPLTAQDSVYSFQIDSDPATPTSKFRIERTASYTALDDRNVEWVGLPGFLDQTYPTNFWSPLPQHLLAGIPSADLLEADQSVRQPVGWGPYIITEWKIGNSILLQKNPNYYRAEEGLPKFDTLVYRFIGSSETTAELILNGECDLMDIEAVQSISLDELINLDQSGALHAYFIPIAAWEHADFGIVPAAYDDGFQLGVDRPDFFGDVRTRRAIAYCMDRQKIVNTLLFGLSEVPDTYLPSTHPLYNPDITQYAFDPAAGMTLLDEVGWRDTDGNPSTPRLAQGIPNVPEGTSLAFSYWTTTSTTRQQVAQILAESLAQCGVQLNLQALDSPSLFAAGPEGPLFGRQFDMAQIAWLTGITPPCDLFISEQIPGEDVARFPYRWGGTNLTGYSSPAFDTACKNALSLLPGQPGYVEAHHLTQQIFAEDLPVIPLYLRLWNTVSRPDFCNHQMDPTADSDFWNLEEYDYGDGC